MEWWILSGLALLVVVVGVVNRIRRPRRGAARYDRKTIYPLW
jgi:hypothetical protein